MKNVTKKNNPSLRSQIRELLINPNIQKGVLQGARKFTKGITGKRIVFFSSKKMNAFLPCESKLEADSCMELEMKNSVIVYSTQTLTVQYAGHLTYTPDATYMTTLGDIIVREVKASGALKNLELLKKLRLIKRFFNNNGIIFEVITEKELHKEPFYYNRKYLYRNSHVPVSNHLLDFLISKFFPGNDQISLRRLRYECVATGYKANSADKLLQKGLLSYNHMKKVTPETLVWKIGE